ncbi:MAG: helix-turn-helix transcriptional regulator [Clostridia bacterium]|nr:helix-turn-helix transcriptional regulator [Clostridia bacterium]
MFKTKAKDGKNNISGKNIAKLRKKFRYSQRELADKLQLMGIDVGKNSIQKIESGKGYVNDIELKALAEIFNVTATDLLKE